MYKKDLNTQILSSLYNQIIMGLNMQMAHTSNVLLAYLFILEDRSYKDIIYVNREIFKLQKFI